MSLSKRKLKVTIEFCFHMWRLKNMIDLIIGMSVLGVVSFFAWAIGYSKGLKDCKKNRRQNIR